MNASCFLFWWCRTCRLASESQCQAWALTPSSADRVLSSKTHVLRWSLTSELSGDTAGTTTSVPLKSRGNLHSPKGQDIALHLQSWPCGEGVASGASSWPPTHGGFSATGQGPSMGTLTDSSISILSIHSRTGEITFGGVRTEGAWCRQTLARTPFVTCSSYATV